SVAPGTRVNIERPMPASGRFDGHIVQGHVDGVGEVVVIEPEGEARRVRVAVPDELARYIVEKGSITVDGVSLTVTAVGPDAWFEIVLIPHTLEVTVLGGRRLGDLVNLEVDVLAKYVERLMVK
ncbi:MAG: riboflavin synthase, partial [Acidimicrobiia bacterium]